MVLKDHDEYDGFDELNDFLDQLNFETNQVAKSAGRGFQIIGTREAKRLSRERLPSGGRSYARTIHTDKNTAGSKLTITITSTHPWREAIEYGTKAHDIDSDHKMKANPLLPYKGSREYGVRYENRTVSGYHFDHPGARAFYIFRDTYRILIKKAEATLNRALDRMGF